MSIGEVTAQAIALLPFLWQAFLPILVIVMPQW